MARRTFAPEPPDKITRRSLCPTCDGREPEPGEEAYAACLWCSLTPEAPDAEPGTDTGAEVIDHPTKHPSPAPRTRIA